MDNQPYSEPITIAIKILGALAAFFSLRWLINIFKGKDGRLDQDELKKLVALVFFVTAAGYVIYKEGERTDLSHELYGPIWLAIIFGSLLTVLHLDKALDSINRLVEAIVRLRTGSTTSSSSSETKTEVK